LALLTSSISSRVAMRCIRLGEVLPEKPVTTETDCVEESGLRVKNVFHWGTCFSFATQMLCLRLGITQGD
jgi:hypothetical protein